MSVVTAITDDGLCRKRLEIEVPAEAVQAETQRVVAGLRARAKVPGEDMIGAAVELVAAHHSGTERPAYERLISDAIRGDQSLFAREDWVEAAWRVVDAALEDDRAPLPYEPGTWGPKEAASLLRPGDKWHDPA